MENKSRNKHKNFKSVTFGLVSVSNSDTYSASEARYRTLMRKISQNNVWKNREVKEVPKELLDVLDPHDFGIHENLAESHKEIIINNIYGNKEKYKNYVSEDSKPNANKIAEEDLDGDCYFPKDGYDYEQHLATINPKYFIPATTENINTEYELGDSVHFPDLNKLDDDHELHDLFDAVDNDDFEPLDDDFVIKASDNTIPLVDENELLWGEYKPIIPQFSYEEPGSSVDLEDVETLDNQNNCATPLNTIDDQEHTDNELSHDVPSKYGENYYRKEFSSFEKSVVKIDKSMLNPTNGYTIDVTQLLNDTSDDTDESYEFETDPSEGWDVETVLTTYTNNTNHPKIVSMNKIRSGAKPKSIQVENTKKEDIDVIHLPEIITERRRDETAEEKKARKASVKNAKAVILQLKRDNKEALKMAKKNNASQTTKRAYDINNGVKYLRL